MSYSIARLTLYAILSSIESDLRGVILKFCGHLPSEQLFDKELFEKAKIRWEKEKDVEEDLTPELLIQYLDFGDLHKTLISHSKELSPDVSKSVKELHSKFEKLIPIRNRVAHSRPLDFEDLPLTLEIADFLLSFQELDWGNLKNTLLKMKSEPSFILKLPIPTFKDDISKINHNLPIPDFDETGFLGRKDQINILKKVCFGAYPVISVLGEGGIGKTALALKVAYEVIDSPNNPFDAVVWTSSKTTQLTHQDILNIKGAICSSLGLFQEIAYHLSGQSNVDRPIEEILEYLSEFKILLILDNLETVLDERIRLFLGSLPNGSKVLITSRIGVGAFEYPIKLLPMDNRESIYLLRALARNRSIQNLYKLDDAILGKYCNLMQNNPGFIKWFVSAVQAGSSPELVLSKTDLFLDFCMSNVYGFLTSIAKQVLSSMICVSGQMTQPELSYINNLAAIEIQRAILELLRTNMVAMTSNSVGTYTETRYELADLAKQYLIKQHPASPSEYTSFNTKKKQLVAASEQFKAGQGNISYDMDKVFVRSQSDIIIAKYLHEALRLAKKSDMVKAEKFIEEALNLAPEYYEVHRINAMIKARSGNYSAALEEYDAAIRLEPKSAPLHKFYGDFLFIVMSDNDGALREYKVALIHDPNAIDIKIELARVLLYSLKFIEAKEILKELVICNETLISSHRIKVLDLYLQTFYRSADDYFQNKKDISKAIESLTEFKNAYENCPSSLIDNKIVIILDKVHDLLQKCNLQNCFDKDREQVKFLLSWIKSELSVISENPEKIGIVGKLFNSTYGFIRDAKGNSLFFHKSLLLNPSDWEKIKVGSSIGYILGKDDSERPCATNVRVYE